MELKDLAIQLNDNAKITNIRWKSRSIEISTDGGKSYRIPTYYETINLYTADLCDCDGSGGNGGTSIDVDGLKQEIESYILDKYPEIDVESLKASITSDEDFKKEVASLVEVDNPTVDTDAIATKVETNIKADETFKSEVAKLVETPEVDTEAITSTVETNIKADSEFKKEVAALVEVSGDGGSVDTETIETNVKNSIKSDETFKSEIAKSVTVDTESIASTVETNVKKDATFKSEVAKLVEVDTNSIETNIKADEEFKKSVASLVDSSSDVDTDSIVNTVETNIKADSEFKTEITNSTKTSIKADETFKKELAGLVETASVDTDAIATSVETAIKEDTDFKTAIANTVETNVKSDETFKSAVAALVDTDTIESNIKSDEEFKSGVISTIETDVKTDDEFKSAVAALIDTDAISEDIQTSLKANTDFKAAIAALIDIDKSFLTENGFGNLRYYNNNFSYYNGSNWIDIVITDNNQFIINMTPANMPSFGTYIERDDKCISLIWEEPEDTIVDNQVLCYVEGVKIVRKLGSEPENISDGDLILDVKRAEFNTHSLVSTAYMDKTVDFTAGNTYYYKFFPYASNGLVTNSTLNCKSITITDYTLFGFKLDQTESDPASMITYIEENRDYKSAYMDYDADTFNYGSWENAWFIRKLKPCMLKLDGTVDYELNKNNYALKTNGAVSDVANTDYEGNVMVGIPKVYWKIVDNGDDTCNVYLCDTKLDDDFHCWSHIDEKGNEIDYCYMAAYDAYYNSTQGRMQSVSGVTPRNNGAIANDLNYIKNNNPDSDTHIWQSNLFCDRILITLLLLLIGKSTDAQSVFGGGYSRSASGTTTPAKTGTLNSKGLFWGVKAVGSTSIKNVKVFGMESFWGNMSKRVAGLISNKGIYKVKMVYGIQDGSTVEGYNTTGSGYISLNNTAPSGTSGGYINKLLFSKYGLLPINVSGSSTTYYPDAFTFSNTLVSYFKTGGTALNGYQCGPFCYIGNGSTVTGTTIGEGLSCKPLASTSSSTTDSTESTEDSTTETTEEVSE